MPHHRPPNLPIALLQNPRHTVNYPGDQNKYALKVNLLLKLSWCLSDGVPEHKQVIHSMITYDHKIEHNILNYYPLLGCFSRSRSRVCPWVR